MVGRNRPGYKQPGQHAFAKVVDLASKIRSGELSSRSCTELMLERIERYNPQLNAYVTVCAEEARQRADVADRELAAGGDRGALHGVPIALKDLIATRGVRTTAGTLFQRDWIPDQDAEVVARLESAGAVILGKTGLDELAWGSTSSNPHYGDVSNPYDLDCHPGGSSGGSAAAVAAGLAYASVATDTGCSIRQPAHCCGIVGFKPSFGRVSTRGVTPLVPSMDHVGSLARCVADAAIVVDAISDRNQTGAVGFDPCGLHRDRGSIFGFRIGIVRSFFFDELDREVEVLVSRALDIFPALGAEVVEVELPDLEEAFEAAGSMFYEVRDNWSRIWHEQPELLSEDLRSRLGKVLNWSRDRYEAALASRERWRVRLNRALDTLDALVAPTSAVPARSRHEPTERFARERWRNTSIFNLVGWPSISVPCGYTSVGLPVGLMISGRSGEDASVLQVAFCFQRGAAWHRYHPEGFSR